MNRMARRNLGRGAGRILIVGALAACVMPGSVGAQPTPPPGVAYSAGLVPGSRTIFALDLAAEPLGEFPKSVKLLKGNMELVLKDGARMLKATSASEFLITLPEFLPQDFTVEFALVPKLCCSAPDLSFEGTRSINQDVASAHLLWHATGYLSVIGGGGDTYESPMPETLRATLPGVLTHVVADFQGTTVKLYTNGQRHYTLVPREWELRLLGAKHIGTYRLAIELLYLHWCNKAKPVTLSGKTAKAVKLPARSKSRALVELERLGLVSVARQPRRSPRVTLLHTQTQKSRTGSIARPPSSIPTASSISLW